MPELVSVSPEGAEFFHEGRIVTLRGLAPDSNHDFEGAQFRTLPGVGAVRSRVVTMNDVHFGEVECGKIDGLVAAAFVVAEGERPYPEVMNEAVIADALALEPDAVIVKGDLTSFGTWDEYRDFLAFYEPAFGERLTHVRGNHDSYPGETFADWPVQIVDTTGLRVILVDTSRAGRTDGTLDAEQVAAVVEAAKDWTETVMVMGHHPLFIPGRDRELRFDGVEPEATLALVGAVADLDNVVAYSAGHSHRCRRVDLGGLAVIEVACVKDFPGAFAEHVVGATGVAHMVHRASAPAAIAWAEKTRVMFDGYYATYAMGLIEDRSFVLPLFRTEKVRITN